jgi:hypothetical protein
MERPREVEQPGPYDLPLPWGSEEGHEKSYYRFANRLCPLRDSARHAFCDPR